MINQASQKQQKLYSLEFINNWISVEEISNRLTQKIPFKKLKIFQTQNLTRAYESSIYRIYMEKIYIIIYAYMTSSRLQFSKKLYESNGLIFGIYNMQKQEDKPSKKFKGIQMIQSLNPKEPFDIRELKNQFGPVGELRKQVENIDLYNIQEYTHSIQGIIDILEEYDNLPPLTFIEKIEKLPLIQHYIHKVRLENAMLSPVFNEKGENWFTLKLKEEQRTLDGLFYDYGESQEAYNNLGNILEDIYNSLYNRCKIGTAEGPQFRTIKQYKEGKTYEQNFAIILSQYRNEVVTNEKKIEDSQPNSTGNKDKPWTKIQIKSKNGALQPISGNVIFVKFIWQVIPKEHKTFLEVHCCNNRKVEEMYYNEIEQFWEKLEKDERFQSLSGVDKYSIELNQNNESLQVIFSNYIPYCLLTNAIKEIDKIVALSLCMDEVIQICERKGLQKQGFSEPQIKPYMINQVIKKFQWSLNKIEKESFYCRRMI